MYETSGRKTPVSDEDPLDGMRPAFQSEGDFATKSYDLEELKRLRAMSNRASAAVLAAGAKAAEQPQQKLYNEDDEDEDEDNATSVNLPAIPAVAPQVREIVTPLPDDGEDDPLDDGPTKMRVTDDPRASKASAVRPAAGARDAPRAATPHAPAISATAPRVLYDDEESNDEQPTVNKKGSEHRAERAILARGKIESPIAKPPVEDDEDDPLDDGPTKMRPQETFALEAGRLPPPPPAVELDRNSHTSILDSPRGDSDTASRSPLETAPWDLEPPPDPLMGATARLPAGVSMLRSIGETAALPRSGNPNLTTGPLPSPGSTTATMPRMGAPVSPSWGVSPQAPSSAPMVSPPVGPPPMGPSSMGPATTPPPPMGPGGYAPLPLHPPGMQTQTGLPAPVPNRQRLIAALVGVGLGLGVLFVYGAFSEPDPADPGAASPSASASVAASIAPPPPVVSAAPTVSAAPAPVVSVAEVEARAALTKLRDGLNACVQHNQGGLPETASAVPTSLRLTRPDGYMAKAEDWKASVWSCSKASVSAAMHYQIQWQSMKPYLEGTGVAWIDANGDGVPDRALSFHATMKSRGKVELGEIGPIDPSRKVASP